MGKGRSWPMILLNQASDNPIWKLWNRIVFLRFPRSKPEERLCICASNNNCRQAALMNKCSLGWGNLLNWSPFSETQLPLQYSHLLGVLVLSQADAAPQKLLGEIKQFIWSHTYYILMPYSSPGLSDSRPMLFTLTVYKLLHCDIVIYNKKNIFSFHPQFLAHSYQNHRIFQI